jgi:hypothetical protein
MVPLFYLSSVGSKGSRDETLKAECRMPAAPSPVSPEQMDV